MTVSGPSLDRDGGFTLVEVLVSMFIFSLISVGALIALSTTLDAREAAETRIEQVERLAAARRLMADDFAAMILRQNRDGLGGFVDPAREAARTDGFELIRRGRPNPNGVFARGDLLRISWRVADGQLIRSFLPHENPAYVKPPIDRVILDGVEAIQVERVQTESTTIDDLLDMAQRTDFTGMVLNGLAVSVTLTHSNGTTTRHIFELPHA